MLSRCQIVTICLISIAILLLISIFDLLPTNLLSIDAVKMKVLDFPEKAWLLSMDICFVLFILSLVQRAFNFYWLQKHIRALLLVISCFSFVLLRCFASDMMKMFYFLLGIVLSQGFLMISSIMFTKISYDLNISIITYVSDSFRPIVAIFYSCCFLATVIVNIHLFFFVQLMITFLPLVISLVPNTLPVSWLTLSLQSLFALMFLLPLSSLLLSLLVSLLCFSYCYLIYAFFFRREAFRTVLRAVFAEAWGSMSCRSNYIEIPSEEREEHEQEERREVRRLRQTEQSENNQSSVAVHFFWMISLSVAFVISVLFFLFSPPREALWRGMGRFSWFAHWTIFFFSYWFRSRQFGRFQAMKEEFSDSVEMVFVSGGVGRQKELEGEKAMFLV